MNGCNFMYSIDMITKKFVLIKWYVYMSIINIIINNDDRRFITTLIFAKSYHVSEKKRKS